MGASENNAETYTTLFRPKISQILNKATITCLLNFLNVMWSLNLIILSCLIRVIEHLLEGARFGDMSFGVHLL